MQFNSDHYPAHRRVLSIVASSRGGGIPSHLFPNILTSNFPLCRIYRYSRFPPLTPTSFTILPRGRILALERISISTPWFDPLTLNAYTNLGTIIFSLPGDIFLARSDLSCRNHRCTIRRFPSSSKFKKSTLQGAGSQPDNKSPASPDGSEAELLEDDDGPDRYDDDDDDDYYYEALSEVDDPALIAYARRDYRFSSAFYDSRAVMCRGISSSVDVFFCFGLRHLDALAVSKPAEAQGREVLVSIVLLLLQSHSPFGPFHLCGLASRL